MSDTIESLRAELAQARAERDALAIHVDTAYSARKDLLLRIERAEAERDALLAALNRLPPWGHEGFYIDHGEHGKEPVSVDDVMRSLFGAIRAARAKETK